MIISANFEVCFDFNVIVFFRTTKKRSPIFQQHTCSNINLCVWNSIQSISISNQQLKRASQKKGHVSESSSFEVKNGMNKSCQVFSLGIGGIKSNLMNQFRVWESDETSASTVHRRCFRKEKTSSLPSAKDENVELEASQKLQPQNNYRSLKAGPKETKKKEKNSRGAGSAIEL